VTLTAIFAVNVTREAVEGRSYDVDVTLRTTPPVDREANCT
jgi:hypothetical protein